jgi:hypothetical protein
MQWLMTIVRFIFATVGILLGLITVLGGIEEFQNGTLGEDMAGLVICFVLTVVALRIGFPSFIGRIISISVSIAGIAALSFAMLFGGAILLGNAFHIQPTQVFISVLGGLLAVGVSFIGSE